MVLLAFSFVLLCSCLFLVQLVLTSSELDSDVRKLLSEFFFFPEKLLSLQICLFLQPIIRCLFLPHIILQLLDFLSELVYSVLVVC